MWGKTPPSTASSRMEKTVKRNQHCQKDGELKRLLDDRDVEMLSQGELCTDVEMASQDTSVDVEM